MKRLLLATILFFSVACASHQPPVVQAPLPVSDPVVVISRALKSVVHIEGTYKDAEGDTSKFGCSAFAIAPRKLLTAAHCVPPADAEPVLKIGFLVAHPDKVDTKLDLAVLLLDEDLPVLQLRDEPPQRFEKVTGLGYGYSLKYPTVTTHTVIMLDYTPEPDEIAPGTWYMGGFIGGMSGGPVIDQDGLVVGIVQRGTGAMGYGVSATVIRSFLAASSSESTPAHTPSQDESRSRLLFGQLRPLGR